MSWITDQMLRFLQRSCTHPGRMVACDVTEGGAGASDLAVSWCRRCGAVAVVPTFNGMPGEVEWQWRLPDPNLWRGR